MAEVLDRAAAAERPMRADARRNYQRLLEAARVVFARDGSDAAMESIAKEAVVGVGTLYRHFPTRRALVEAVYRDDVDQLAQTAHRVTEELAAWAALDEFLHAYVRYAFGKRIFLAELLEAFHEDPSLKQHARGTVIDAMSHVLAHAQAAGVARGDVTGEDVMQLVSTMCTSPSLELDQSERLLRVVLDGLAIRGD